HVVGVAYSAFDMQIYINGEQSPTTTDGSATYIAGNSSHGSIGRRVDPNNTYSFDGEIDEVRLWNVARTQKDLRDFMCKKVDPNTSGLLGYWIADEFYSSSTILDNTFPAEDGYIVGNVEKTTSGAPLGDESQYMYTNDWTGKLLSLTAATGDKIGAKNITGNPHGVQMYLVNSEPYYTDSLNITPNYYFGVFCAESATAASYKVGYKYKYQNGIITAENEGLADVYTRMDGSVSEWHDLNANHDLSSNEFKKDNQISRGEYILNVEDGLRSAETSLFTSKGSINMISIFPNPAVNHITVDLSQVYEPIHSIRIIDLTGKIYYENKFIKNTKEFTADISTFSAGHYVVELITGSGRISGKFEVVR
nr:T9SS type A sorting domain-containing protein [Chitinophagales bacterium]